MAKVNIKLNGDYKKTRTYKEADKQTKQNYENWRKDQQINGNQMYLLLKRQDYKELPADQRRKANVVSETLLISGAAFVLIAMMIKNDSFMVIAFTYMLICFVVYLSGFLSPIQSAIRTINKELKKYPAVKSFQEYMQTIENAEK